MHASNRLMKFSLALAGASMVGIALVPAGAAPAKEAPRSGKAAERVTLYRDAMGVPHVFGDTSAAVLYGTGYALGQDRLAAIELAFRGARGGRSELMGPSTLERDKTALQRMLGDAELMRMYRELTREHQMMMQAFVDGLNQAIKEVLADPEHKLPYEYVQWGIQPKPWRLIDYLNYVASLPGGREGNELTNLSFLNAMITRYGEEKGRKIFDDVVPISDPDTPLAIPRGEDLAPAQPMPVSPRLSLKAGGVDLTTVVTADAGPDEAERQASRCLVIGPKKSASGRVLMMEATADGPEVHMHGGGFDSTGFNFAGYGPPVMGRGVQHGWLVTSGVADATDTFAEKLNPANKYQYWFRGEWRTMAHRTETIKVKGKPDVQYEVASTIHGPVIRWDATHNIAYSHRYAVRGTEIQNWAAIVDMGRARNLDEFKKNGIDRIGWNLGICYGGEDGQIAFFEAGKLPKRAPGADPRLPTPGTGEYEWTGFLSTAEHPHVINPKQGYIHAWNSKATTWSLEGDDTRSGATFRTWLGNKLARETNAITLLDMRTFNRKIFNAMGARDLAQAPPEFFAPYLNAAAAASNDPDVKQAVALMTHFNGLYEDLDHDGLYDDPGLVLFRTWLGLAPEMVFGSTMGDWWQKVDADRYEKYQSSLLLRAFQGDKAGAPLQVDYFSGKDRTAVMIETIQRTIAKVKPQFAGKPMTEWRLPIYWKYYDSSRRTADRPPLPDDGEAEPPRLAAKLNLAPVAIPNNGGEGWVGLMEIGPDHPVLYSVVEQGGQSLFIDRNGKGNPHLNDQTRMHQNSEFKRTVMAPADVEATAVSKQELIYTPGTQ